MKLVVSRISFSDFINRNKPISFILNSIFNLFFSTLRLISKQFAYDNGNLLIISLHRLGDTIFTIPAIREVQKHFKKKIIIACYPESVPIYKLAFEDIHFCELEHRDFYFNDRLTKFKAKKKLKMLRSEIIIDLIGSMSSASLIYNLRAKEIVGMTRIQFKAIYDHYVEFRESPQLIDIYLDVISSVIQIPDRNALKKLSKSTNPEGKILIHPFATWREKEWNLNKFIELALKLKKVYSVNFISPSGKLYSDVLDEIRNKGIDIAESNSVDELIENIRKCSLFIGNDSGPVNIANFLGRPTFTIYGATNHNYTATSGEHQLYIQKKLGCSARSNEKFCIVGGAAFICPGIQCMNLLSVDEVYNQLKPLADEYCTRK
ncbi:MAG: glycosyltransferase family 9 protein [Ignavibacteria bacterium]|nr:glycosyltransferase family 9 protein [Ignavibacteria bacterium]